MDKQPKPNNEVYLKPSEECEDGQNLRTQLVMSDYKVIADPVLPFMSEAAWTSPVPYVDDDNELPAGQTDPGNCKSVSNADDKQSGATTEALEKVIPTNDKMLVVSSQQNTIYSPVYPLMSEANTTTMTTWTDADAQISVDDDINISTMEELEKIILDRNNTAAVYPLLLIVTGFPKAGKTTAIKRMFSLQNQTTQITGNNDNFMSHEFISTGVNRIGKKIRTGLVNHDCQSFKYAIQSGLCKMQFDYQQEARVLKFELPENHETMRLDQYGKLKLKTGLLQCHLTAIAQHIQTRQHLMTPRKKSTNYSSIVKNDAQQRAMKRFEESIRHNDLAIGSIWDMSINNTIRPFIESLGYSFTHTRMWVFIDMNEDYKQLHVPLDYKTDGKNLRMQWKPRIQYLMRICQICKHTPQREPAGYKRYCTIFAVNKARMPSLEEIEELKSELENAAMQMGVYDVINFDIRRLHVTNKVDMKTVQLRISLNNTLYNLGDMPAENIPLSWLFLRSALADSEKFYIGQRELESLAKDCQIIDDLENFCKFFSSFGSIFYIKQCDYIIIKPAEFLTQLQIVLNQTESCVDRMKSVSNDDEEVVIKVLVSTRSFALSTSDLYLDVSNIPFATSTNSQIYYLPEVAQEASKMHVEGSSVGAFQLIMSMKSPRIGMHTIVTKQLLKQLNLEPQLAAKFHTTNFINSVIISVEGDIECPALEGNGITEKNTISTEVKLVFQGNITEITFQKNISQLHPDQKTAHKSLCLKITQALHDMLYTMSQEPRYKYGLSYCFAVQCAQDSLGKEAAFNSYRKKHILPNFKLCEDCDKEYNPDDLTILKMWNVAVEKVLKTHERNFDSILTYERDEDLTFDDAKILAAEIAKCPMELIRRFSEKIEVKVYMFEPGDERAKVWLVMGMMLELEHKRSEFFSKKKMAAVLIKMYDELKDNGEEVHGFGKLARLLHLEVLSRHQEVKIIQQLQERAKMS